MLHHYFFNTHIAKKNPKEIIRNAFAKLYDYWENTSMKLI